jgi:hypothetical protein
LPVEHFCPSVVIHGLVARLKDLIGRTFHEKTMCKTTKKLKVQNENAIYFNRCSSFPFIFPAAHDAFVEQVTKILEDRRDVRAEFVSLLDALGLYSEAANWVKKFELVPSHFSWSVQSACLSGDVNSPLIR